ncbi:MAG: iron-containing alcohol dehydrogenase [Christensenellales bacterium]
MNVFYKAYCRVFQFVMKLALPLLRLREPEKVSGLAGLAELIEKQGKKSILIVTDDVLHNKLRLIDGLKEDLANRGIKVAVYDKTVPNPTIDNIEEAYAVYKENASEGIVAFGGGSPMDCAKGVACRVANPDKTIPQMKGVLKVGHRSRFPDLYAVPTTSGTGSEATLAAIVSNSATKEKYPIEDPVLIPKYAVLDPNLTVGLPPHITSTTGMDALTHAVEAYIGSENTELTYDRAVKATKLIFTWLEKAYEDGTNMKARGYMQDASYLAGVAFTRAYVGNVHAMAHALGGFYHTPHGLANAVILPYILDFYGESAYVKLAELADCVGIKGASIADKAKNFIQEIKDMNARMNIPTTIDGIKEEDIPVMAERAFKEANPLYPVPKIMSKQDFIDMYHKIMTKPETND